MVGADGLHSLVARAVNAERYREKAPLLAAYYSYWSGLRSTVVPRPTAAAPRVRGVADQRRSHAGHRRLAVFGVRVEQGGHRGQLPQGDRPCAGPSGSPPESAPRGAVRRHGRAWILPEALRARVGAGGRRRYNKDFITAQGIQDAFRDAERCVRALDEAYSGRRPFQEAMADYQAARDEHVLPMYEFTAEFASLEPPPPELQQLLQAAHGNQEAMDGFARVNAGVTSPGVLLRGERPAHLRGQVILRRSSSSRFIGIGFADRWGMTPQQPTVNRVKRGARQQAGRPRPAINDLWYKNAIIYCLSVGTFMDANGDGVGDFPGLMRRLDYLAGLGMNAIWLMPFQTSPSATTATTFPTTTASTPRYGTLGDFVEFTHGAKQRGIRVIIDLVVNHTSDQHPWFQEARRDPNSRYRDWYVWSDKIPRQREPGHGVSRACRSPPGRTTRAPRLVLPPLLRVPARPEHANPRVQAEILRSWASGCSSACPVPHGRGAVHHLDQRPGRAGSPGAVRLLRSLREFLQWRVGDAIILAEANSCRRRTWSTSVRTAIACT